jgi:AmmeMemoRadiSam system protein A
MYGEETFMVMSEGLTLDEKRTLLRLARSTLESHYAGLALPEPAQPTEALMDARGAFVTLLAVKGELRGCIGHVEGVEPLWKSVRENALAAALRDPRFPPVEPGELSQLVIEVSVLSPMVKVASIDEIVVGRDGLLIERGAARGLLLPQVATDHRWDTETFLKQTCIKAGLADDCWRSAGARISRFSAEVFSEKEIG